MGAAEQGTEFKPGTWLVQLRTLVFLTNGEDVLLMKRSARRSILPGRWNGLGGKLERHEDPLAGALREVEEESGIRPTSLSLGAIYHIDAGNEKGVLILVFIGEAATRQLRPTHPEEGELRWLPRAELMNLDLVDDLRELLPRLFATPDRRQPLFIHLSYDPADQPKFHFHDGQIR